MVPHREAGKAALRKEAGRVAHHRADGKADHLRVDGKVALPKVAGKADTALLAPDTVAPAHKAHTLLKEAVMVPKADIHSKDKDTLINRVVDLHPRAVYWVVCSVARNTIREGAAVIILSSSNSSIINNSLRNLVVAWEWVVWRLLLGVGF